MPVQVVTDSSACMPEDLAASLGVSVVPLGISLGDEALPAHEVDRRAVLERIAAGEPVTTSSPSPGDYLRAVEGQPEVLVVTVASSMSAAYEAAALAAEQAEGEVRVLDSGTAVGGLTLVVLAAARRAREGAGLDEVERTARQAAAEVGVLAVVGSMERLRRSGRVGEAEAEQSVLFSFAEGNPTLLDSGVSTDVLLERWRDTMPSGGAVLHAAAMHADSPQEARGLLDAVTSEAQPETALVCEFDAAMLVHTGPDVVGLAWRWEEA